MRRWSRYCTSWMPFVSPNQQQQSSEGQGAACSAKVHSWSTGILTYCSGRVEAGNKCLSVLWHCWSEVDLRACLNHSAWPLTLFGRPFKQLYFRSRPIDFSSCPIFLLKFHVQCSPARFVDFMLADFHYRFTKSSNPDLTITNMKSVGSPLMYSNLNAPFGWTWVFEILNSESLDWFDPAAGSSPACWFFGPPRLTESVLQARPVGAARAQIWSGDRKWTFGNCCSRTSTDRMPFVTPNGISIKVLKG